MKSPPRKRPAASASSGASRCLVDGPAQAARIRARVKGKRRLAVGMCGFWVFNLDDEEAAVPDHPKGILYLVATPIGNLADFSFRAVAVLQAVDFIACEDTRHSRPLLERHGVSKPLVALHEHNEDAASARLLERQ